MLSVCLCITRLSIFECLNQCLLNLVCISRNLSPISTAYFINSFHQFVSTCIPPIVAKQELCENVIAAMNTQTTTEFLDASFSMWFVSYKMKGDRFNPELLISFEYAYITVRLCSNEWLTWLANNNWKGCERRRIRIRWYPGISLEGPQKTIRHCHDCRPRIPNMAKQACWLLNHDVVQEKHSEHWGN
jgi:hypothetical protein